jgi:3-dehydroquinate synthase
MKATCVEVSLAERSYSIAIMHRDLHRELGECLKHLQSPNHLVMIADQAVEPHVKAIQADLANHSLRCDTLYVSSGEASKSLEQLGTLWNQLLECRTDRSSVVVAVGGGVIGDLAGFAAASFARGLRFIQIPTTLLAMVDSSVGGKTGINLPSAKNMVGAFWQPSAVLIDTDVLSTLPDREYRSGLAEIVKYGVILDANFFEYLEQHADAIMERSIKELHFIIARSCQLKAQVVEQDERETTGLRAILNYGHTFGHAIEAATEYGRWLHGEAIAIGMTMAANLAVDLGMFSAKQAKRQADLLTKFQLPIQQSEVSPEQLWSLMQHDKKVERGKLRFILPTQIGHVERRDGIEKAMAIRAMQAKV